MNMDFDSLITLKLLKLLKEEPALTQRELKHKIGVNLGKINYCISALVEEVMIRGERLKIHKTKSAYIYRLTPKGFEEITDPTLYFLRIRIKEYDHIMQEIKSFSQEIDLNDLSREPDLLEELINIS